MSQSQQYVSGGGGSFAYGPYGFLYKKKVGVGGRRSTRNIPGGGAVTNRATFVYNKYKPGESYIGAQPIHLRRAKNIRASVCTPQNKCFPGFNRLGVDDTSRIGMGAYAYPIYFPPSQSTPSPPAPSPPTPPPPPPPEEVTIYVGRGAFPPAQIYLFYSDPEGTNDITDSLTGPNAPGLDTRKHYIFKRISNGHPFYISSAGYEQPSKNDVDIEGNGTPNSGISSGQEITLQFTDDWIDGGPQGSKLYYYCTAHGNMIQEFKVRAPLNLNDFYIA